MLLIKTLIFLLFCSAPSLIAKENSERNHYRKLNTKIRQAYRFNQLPDDGSYSLEIKNRWFQNCIKNYTFWSDNEYEYYNEMII